MTGRAQLALIADIRSPSVITTGLIEGTSVATAANGIFKSANDSGNSSRQNLSRFRALNRFGQKTRRAISTSSSHDLPAAMAAPTKLPTLVPATMAGLIP